MSTKVKIDTPDAFYQALNAIADEAVNDPNIWDQSGPELNRIRDRLAKTPQLLQELNAALLTAKIRTAAGPQSSIKSWIKPIAVTSALVAVAGTTYAFRDKIPNLKQISSLLEPMKNLQMPDLGISKWSQELASHPLVGKIGVLFAPAAKVWTDAGKTTYCDKDFCYEKYDSRFVFLTAIGTTAIALALIKWACCKPQAKT